MLYGDEVRVRALMGLILLVSNVALAHGTQPAVWQSLSVDAAGSTVVLLSEGVGLRLPDGTWRFVCSARWHGPPSPMAASDGLGATWVVGHEVVWRLDPQSHAPALDASGLDAHAVRGIAASAATVGVLTVGNTGSDVWIVGRDGATPPQLLWHRDDAWPALAGDANGFWLAAMRADGLRLAQVAQDGVAQNTSVALPAALTPLTPRLHVSSGHLYAIVSDGVSEHVGRIDGGVWQELAEDPATVLGPTEIAGALLIAYGGAIRRLASGAQIVTDDNRYFTCMNEDAFGPYACARTELRTVRADGTSGVLRFDIAWLTPPSLVGLASEDTATCWTEWQNFSRDAGLPEGAPADSGDAAQGPDVGHGCQAARGTRSLAGLIPLFAAFAWIRRKRT